MLPRTCVSSGTPAKAKAHRFCSNCFCDVSMSGHGCPLRSNIHTWSGAVVLVLLAPEVCAQQPPSFVSRGSVKVDGPPPPTPLPMNPGARHSHDAKINLVQPRHAHKPPRHRAHDNGLAQRYLGTAGNAAVSGNWRLCADSYLAAYWACTDDWEYRYICWSGFTSVLREGNVQVAASDVQLLDEVASDSSAPSHHRVQAFFTRGFVAHSMLRDDQASAAGYASAVREGIKALADLAARTSAEGESADASILMATSEGYVAGRPAECSPRRHDPSTQGLTTAPSPHRYVHMLTSKLLHDLLDYAEDNLGLAKQAMAEQRRLGELSRPGQRDVHDYDEDEEDEGKMDEEAAKIAAFAGIARHHHGGPVRAVVGNSRDGPTRSPPKLETCHDDASAAMSAQDDVKPAGAYDTPVVHTSRALEFRHTYYEIALRKRDELRAAEARRRKRLVANAMGTGGDVIVVGGGDVIGGVGVGGVGGGGVGGVGVGGVGVGVGGGGVGGGAASAVTADAAGGLSEPPDAVLSASASGYASGPPRLRAAAACKCSPRRPLPTGTRAPSPSSSLCRCRSHRHGSATSTHVCSRRATTCAFTAGAVNGR